MCADAWAYAVVSLRAGANGDFIVKDTSNVGVYESAVNRGSKLSASRDEAEVADFYKLIPVPNLGGIYQLESLFGYLVSDRDRLGCCRKDSCEAESCNTLFTVLRANNELQAFIQGPPPSRWQTIYWVENQMRPRPRATGAPMVIVTLEKPAAAASPLSLSLDPPYAGFPMRYPSLKEMWDGCAFRLRVGHQYVKHNPGRPSSFTLDASQATLVEAKAVVPNRSDAAFLPAQIAQEELFSFKAVGANYARMYPLSFAGTNPTEWASW